MSDAPGRLLQRTVPLALLFSIGFAQAALAQNNPPLNFGNNFFVTGDYVVAGVGLRGLGVNGYATSQFTMPDANSVPSTGVPKGADIVAAILYWETVESSQTANAGQNGFFRPVFTGGPATGYAISGAVLGNPNAPVSWSSGGCSGNAQGSKTMRVYSADVRPFLPVDSKGNVLAGNVLQPMTYEVSLADSGSNGGGAPLTLGASLVIIYRALTPSLPLTSVVIYDGAFSPSNSSSTVTQTLQGFYQAAANPISKLTHIVGNGQNNKFETVSLDGQNLPSLYGSLPTFPGYYNGSWDNPTWSFSGNSNPVNANDASATTMVVPNSSNGGCVSWGTMIFSTTVQNTDNDGILNVWKQNQGYCDASAGGGCPRGTADPSWVSLTGATSGQKDLFVELDYMCSIVKADGTCDTTNGYSFYPSANALAMMTNAFSKKGIKAHFIPGNSGYSGALGTGAILEQTCTDTTDASGNPVLCPFVNQPGIVGWKVGFEFLKNQPLNLNADGTTWTETQCEQNPTTCIRRFQHGRKDSYHYAVFAHAVGLPDWGLEDRSLSSVVASGNTVTFTTASPNGLTAQKDRVTISDAVTNPSLNGTYMVQTASGNTFTIQIPTATNATYTQLTDPRLSVASGQIETTSGVSDVGGADSLISLGLWGAAGQTDQVEAGTFMHELGHSNGLTHGGLYYDTPGNYVPTVEPNCKPNYQSIMSYLFQVDLLDNGVLDYSEQQLNTLNEDGLPAGLSSTDGSVLAYSTTKWYTPVQPNGIGSAATHHCDGTPLLPGTDPNPTMYLVGGPANPITPAWVNGSDVNFDGTIDTTLRGYNDWASIDLRQIGATGNDIFGTGSKTFGTGTRTFGTGTKTFGTGTKTFGTGTKTFGTGTRHGEITLTAANSAVRPPRFLTATLTAPPRYIQLNWIAPTFGQISSYNIYRATNGTPVPPAIASVPGNTLTYTDKNVTCGPTYTYVVTALLSDGRESVPSNSVSQTDCAPPYVFTGFYSPLVTADPANPNSYSGLFNLGKSVTAKWTLQDSIGNLVTNLNANTLYGVGPFAPQADGTCRPSQVNVVAGCSLNNPATCPANTTTLYSPTAGAKGASTFRFSTNQFVFNWDTKTTTAGCYVLELDLDSGQVERTGLKLQ